MATEPKDVKALMTWLLVDSLSLKEAVSLAVGRVPILGNGFPRTFTPLLRAAELAVENGQLVPSNDWKSPTINPYYGNQYAEPKVTQASFRAWLEKALSQELKSDAFFFLAEPSVWPLVADVAANDRLAADIYPDELRAAIEAFEAVSSNPSATAKRTPKAALAGWLKMNKPELSANAQKRIATVANWLPAGGAPKTPVT